MRVFLYILTSYLKYVVGTLVLTTFMFVLFDFIHRSGKYFVKYNPSGLNITLFYVYQIPAQIVQALPIASLIGSVISLVILSRDNEVTAMRAAGMGPFRIAKPLAIGGLMLSFLSLAIGEWVLPNFAQKMHYIKEVKIEGESDQQLIGGAQWSRAGSVMFNFKEYDPIEKSLSSIKLISLSEDFNPQKVIRANEGKYVEEGWWKLDNITIAEYGKNGKIAQFREIQSQLLKLPVEPEKLKKDRRLPNELSTRELRVKVKEGQNSGEDVLSQQMDLHFKYSYPFASFVLSLLGLQFAFRSERTTETVKGFLLAIGVGIAYWFILTAAKALGNQNALPPGVAAWLANIMILIFSIIQVWRQRKP